MSKIDSLSPKFKDKANILLENCRKKGFEFTPYCTIRTPFEQAKLWRQSRTRNEIDGVISGLRASECKFLVHCIESVGPQHGRWATNAIPGLSWHNWGMAIDCFYKKAGVAVWDDDAAYRVYADEAIALGLTAGYYWNAKDSVHVQMYPGSISQKYSMKEINDIMEKSFGKGEF